MNKAMTLHASVQHKNPVSDTLQIILASTYSLYLITHNYHWNIEGERFYSLHKLFEEQYNELFKALDLIAEHIRTFGEYALPFEGNEILESSKLISNALNKEQDTGSRADRMILNLLNLTETTAKHCHTGKIMALDMGDDETANLLSDRIAVHQKAMWMLRSSLK
jgi:starvation-inducible DNA-binding protein